MRKTFDPTPFLLPSLHYRSANSSFAVNENQNDGYDYFEIKMPHQGLVTIKKPLDYETATFYQLRVRATVSTSSDVKC